MCFKIIGALFILVSAYLLGYYYKSKYNYMIKNVVNFEECVDCMQTHILSTSGDVVQLFKLARSRAQKINKALFDNVIEIHKENNKCTIDELWHKAFQRIKDNGHDYDIKYEKHIINFSRYLKCENQDELINNLNRFKANLKEEHSVLLSDSNKVNTVSKISLYVAVIVIIILL